MKVIKIITPAELDGQYLESFDFDAGDGVGFGTFTKDIRQARQFESASAALAFWKTQSTVKPVRADGKPNRPLTASTVAIEDCPSGVATVTVKGVQP